MFTSPTASIKNSSPGYVSWIDILLNIIVIDGKNKMIVKLMGYFIIENTENMDNTTLLRYPYSLQVDAFAHECIFQIPIWSPYESMKGKGMMLSM